MEIVRLMQVWLSPGEARELRRWAVEQGREDLADRFFRAERGSGSGLLPWLRRWRVRHPLLVQCLCCESWTAYTKHRHLKKDGWVRHGSSWLHADCAEEWKLHGNDMATARSKEHARRASIEYLFGAPQLLDSYKGVLVRQSLWQEHTFYGLLDDLEADIQTDFGMRRVRQLIDEMSDDVRARLVGAAFTGFHFRYHVLLGWVESIPSEYDETDIGDDVHCQSVLVDELPRKLRERLPDRVRVLL